MLIQARQGDPAAIATLIQQALATRGIRVRAACQNSCLHVVLAANSPPDRLTYARVVYAAVLCLGVSSIQTLQVYGRQQGQRQPAWVQAFRLMPILESRPEPKVQLGPPQLEPEPLTESPPSVRSREAKRQLKNLSKQPSKQLTPHLLSRKLNWPLALSVGAASLGLGVGLSSLKQLQLSRTPPSDAADAAASASSVVKPAVVNPALAAFPSLESLIPASPAPTSLIASNPADQTVAVTLKAVGDIIPGSNYSGKSNLPTEAGDALTAEREFLFGNIKPFFDQADVLFGNFESTLTDYPDSAKDTSQNMTFAFRTPPVYAEMFQELGFDVLSVANNHSMDFGEPGFADTIQHIEQAGIKAVGQKDQILYKTVNGVPMAFIGFSYLPYQNAMQDLERAGALVREAKQQAKIVVISVHAGAEGSDETHVSDRTEYFFGEDRGNIVAFAHGLIDQGADLILGHGPHVPRAVERYQGKLIAYSLGNFLGYKTLSSEGTLGDSLILTVQMNAEGDFVGGRIIPVALDANGIPKLDDYFQSVVLIRSLTQTDFPQTPLTIDDMGYLLPKN